MAMRLFTSVEIPERIKEEISKISREFDRKGITSAKREAYHITLQFFGNATEEQVGKIREALSSVKRETFTVRLSGLDYFGKLPRVIFIPVKEGSRELTSIYSEIEENLEKVGIFHEKENEYSPHLTIARVRHFADKEEILSKIMAYKYHEFGSFTVESLFLKKSTPTPEGHVHETLLEAKL